MAVVSYAENIYNEENMINTNIKNNLQNIAEFLLKNNVLISIAPGGSSSAAIRYLNDSLNNFDKVFVTNGIRSIQSKVATLKEHLMDSAKIATEFNHTDYGVAISKIYHDADSNKLYCIGSITDFDNTFFVKFISDINSEPENIIASTTNAIMKTLENIVKRKINEEEKKKAKRRLLPLKIALMCCGASIIACITGIVCLIL